MFASIQEEKKVISDYRCFFCFTKAFERLIKTKIFRQMKSDNSPTRCLDY
jgi:hypothetical protein